MNIADIYQRACTLRPRVWLLAGLSAGIGMELSAIYFQFIAKLEPCPLCITQRLIVLALILTLLTGVLHNPGARLARLYFAAAAVLSLTGFAVAAYHFIIQLLPHEGMASCGPGASYILAHYQLTDVLRLFLTGTGDCTEVVWRFLGLSMPFWVGLCFLGLLALFVWQFRLTAYRMETEPGLPLAVESETGGS